MSYTINNLRKEVIIYKMNEKKISKKLKDLRLSSNNTQKDLANLFGVTPSVISMYENGERIPSPTVMKKYAMYFHKTVDEIFFD